MSYCLCDARLQEFIPEVVWVHSPASLLLPDGLFDHRQTEHLLRWHHPETRTDRILTETLPEGAVMAYAIPAQLADFLQEQFPAAEVRHPDIPLIDRLIRETAAGQYRAVYIHPQQNACTLAWAYSGRLEGYNRFPTPTEDDLLYYTGAVLQQLNATQAEVRATLFENDQYQSPLQQRLPRLQFQPIPPCAL
ncbi:MAG: DUF3822 family protein [Paludibacteraceae bacterium]|nr:DUF3822 family protein [Paludibacteraceae bacterium]